MITLNDIFEMICEHSRNALQKQDSTHAQALFVVLHHYIVKHPEAAHGTHAYRTA